MISILVNNRTINIFFDLCSRRVVLQHHRMCTNFTIDSLLRGSRVSSVSNVPTHSPDNEHDQQGELIRADDEGVGFNSQDNDVKCYVNKGAYIPHVGTNGKSNSILVNN